MNISPVIISYLKQIDKNLLNLKKEDIFSSLEQKNLQEIENLFSLKFNPKNFDVNFAGNFVQEKNNRKYIEKRDSLIVLYSKDENSKILLLMVKIIDSIIRTNFFLNKDFVSIKISCEKVSEYSIFNYKYKPFVETFVYSEDFEAIHIRGGKVARGGIRHSERNDYRNEVLALQETQNLKNCIIVPTGAKGGFIIKNTEKKLDKNFVINCYQNFIRGLLDITDNLIFDNEFLSKKTSINKNIICYDEEDSYLVVAADKGTSDFSDFANDISAEYNFWLQNAFASGGSSGYSHKDLGITAKGALECLEQHLLDLEIKSPKEGQVLEVFCFGNMSGDVAGNGMLYSKNFKLIAAVDSSYIFINPNPIDLDEDFEERKRLFKEKGKWNSYNKALLGKGGDVFQRNLEQIVLSDEVKKKFNIKEDKLSPNDLIKKLMQYSYDVFWSGAIGTIVKASYEKNEDILDKPSEGIRIDAKDLKCKIFCEGANLSITQKGRVEFSLNKGMVNTDFIDNSAGVNCSDYEVNLKIALNNSNLEEDVKEKLIKDMESEVCNLVLKNNKMQAEGVSREFKHSVDKIVEHFELISYFKKKPEFEMILKDFPNFEELERRTREFNMGLTKPEIAVLISLSKLEMKVNLLKSDIDFKDQSLNSHIETYFPSALNDVKYKNLILNHLLRKEIVAVQFSNEIIDVNGF